MSTRHHPATEAALGPVEIFPSTLTDHYAAVCGRCLATTSAHPDAYGRLFDWAETHECDPEMAALLTHVLAGIPA